MVLDFLCVDVVGTAYVFKICKARTECRDVIKNDGDGVCNDCWKDVIVEEVEEHSSLGAE
jgi:hypothetical protein